MRLLQAAAPHYINHLNHHQQRSFHLNTTVSVVIVFCGLGASISFMGIVAMYLWCIKARTRAGRGQQQIGTQQEQQARENRELREKLSRRVVERLPTARLTKITKKDSSTDCCSVCLSEFQEEDPEEDCATVIRVLPNCGHYFHSECIQLWLCSYYSCPLCRSSLSGLLALPETSEETSHTSPCHIQVPQ